MKMRKIHGGCGFEKKKKEIQNFCVEIESRRRRVFFALHNICWFFWFGKIPLKI